MTALPQLGANEIGAWESSVVPRYLSLFGEAALDMLLTANGGDFAHLGCRTGYPDVFVAERLVEGTLTGVDSSPAALELARAQGTRIANVSIDYRLGERLPTELSARRFTHVMSLHPDPRPLARQALLSEMARLLVPHGQALMALPLRGSFQELVDLLREYTVKHDAHELARTLDEAVAARPTVELLSEELEDAGFDHVDVDLWPTVIDFRSGRDLFDDAVAHLLVIPELRILLSEDNLEAPLAYVRDAIDCYWPDGDFELTVNVGCASGRRVAG